jgi:protein-tyrosine phosphatase
MIDLHAHVLPGIDDGAINMDESLSMLEFAQADGITTIVGTPHFGGIDQDFVECVSQRWNELRQTIDANATAVNLLLGFELLLTPALLNHDAKVQTLGINGGRYLLVELPSGFWPPYLYDVVFRLQSLGMRPILAHAERYQAIARDPELAVDLVARGVLLQVNGDSVLSLGGRPLQRCAHGLLERGLVSFLSSDAHSIQRRPPRLQAAVASTARVIGPAAAQALVESNPAAVIADVDLPSAPPLRRQWRFFSFVRRMDIRV